MEAAAWVLKMATSPRTLPLRVDPPYITGQLVAFETADDKGHTLNPIQPNQIITVPRNTNVVLCGVSRDPSGRLCLRFPRTNAYASAAHPEAM